MAIFDATVLTAFSCFAHFISEHDKLAVAPVCPRRDRADGLLEATAGTWEIAGKNQSIGKQYF